MEEKVSLIFPWPHSISSKLSWTNFIFSHFTQREFKKPGAAYGPWDSQELCGIIPNKHSLSHDGATTWKVYQRYSKSRVHKSKPMHGAISLVKSVYPSPKFSECGQLNCNPWGCHMSDQSTSDTRDSTGLKPKLKMPTCSVCLRRVPAD